MEHETKTSTERPLDPAPDIWEELGRGNALRMALDHFYTRVLADERLSHFFQHVGKRRIVDKQYSFLHAKLTGTDVYFGERPRNAHHWMVISDELFDYRESLLEQSLREHSFSERAIAKIRGIDEAFRKQIVKSAPRHRKLGGITLPLEGFGIVELTIATLCDDCEQAIESGEVATYHNRTGRTFCRDCASANDSKPPGGL